MLRRINRADVEMQTKALEGGHKLTLYEADLSNQR
jgi:hypothetical protein